MDPRSCGPGQGSYIPTNMAIYIRSVILLLRHNIHQIQRLTNTSDTPTVLLKVPINLIRALGLSPRTI